MKTKQTSGNPLLMVRFANLILGSAAIGSWLVLAYGIRHLTATRTTEPSFLWGFTAICIIASALCGMALRLSGHAKVNLVLVAVSTIMSLYLAELGLTVIKPGSGLPSTESHDVDGDTRDKLTVLKQLRASGLNAYPSLVPDQYLSTFNQNNQKLFPFGGISNSTTVYCNENGYWSIYDSDEHGFNNPSGLYTSGSIDIAIIGIVLPRERASDPMRISLPSCASWGTALSVLEKAVTVPSSNLPL